jgi:hypothetical protein
MGDIEEVAERYRERGPDGVSAGEFLHAARTLGVRAGLLLRCSGLRRTEVIRGGLGPLEELRRRDS